MSSANGSTFREAAGTDNAGGRTIPLDHHRPFVKIRNRSGSTDVHYSLLYEGLPEEFRIMAEKELNETADSRRRGLQKLREYMESQGFTPLKDDLLLVSVLRNCKYHMKKAEAKLKNFLSARREIIALLRELGMEKVESILDDMPYGLLPYRDKCGRVIYYTRPYGLRLDRYEVTDVGLVVAAGAVFLLSYPLTSVAGFAFFGECKSPSLGIFYGIFKTFKRYMPIMFSMPMRFQRVEILNENAMCRCFKKLLDTIVSRKIMSRVSLYGSNFDQFHQMYDPEILPEDFGGKMGPLSNELYRQKFLDFVRDLISEDC